MKRTVAAVSAGLLLVASCGGSPTASTQEESAASTEQTLSVPGDVEIDSSQPAETVPALLDPSTDIDAIDQPVVLWFWSPG